MTPPQTAGPGAIADLEATRTITLDFGRLHDSQHWLPSQMPSTPTIQPLLSPFLDERNTSRPRLRKALSDSTIQESVARESAGGFKIVITRPGEDGRPKTVEDINDKAPHFLEIAIPSGKLGTPRWSARGTPFLRGSSYAPTEEFRSSHHPSPRTPHFATNTRSRRPGSIMNTPATRLSSSQRSRYISSAGISQDHALRATYMSTHMVIEPSMFDALTFKPACDDRAIVRYSASVGAVTAATPPRLVAEITSPTFLDYELLSDFFLTFRSYLAPLDLLKMLFARMRWSLAKNDEVGTVVRVRTFVALRHWILNYFVDDFVVEYDMRKHFCALMNSLSEEMIHCPSARRVQLKILAELKKCWRRVCAQFWDGPEFDANLPQDVPITPGGIPGHRNPSLDPGFWKQFFHDGPPTLDQVYAPLASNPPDVETSFSREVAQAGADETGLDPEHRPGTPKNETLEQTFVQHVQLSPASVSSAEAVSCSLPLKFSSQKSRHRLAAHPADPGSIFTIAEPVATAPRALQGKRVRPEHSHKRNKSTPDVIKERGATLENMLRQNTETIMALPYAGSLVRGNVLPPGQAFVEVLTPTTINGTSRQTTYLRLEMDHASKDRDPPAAMSGQGMRRLISSVRRALSTRGQDLSPTQGNFSITPIGPRGVTVNRLPGTAIVPQSRPRANNFRPPVRIDLLGAESVEDFKRVVREDAAEVAAQSFHGSIPSTPTTIRVPEEDVDNTSHLDRLNNVPQGDDDKRPFSEGGLTSGSKSIVIVDDTLRAPPDQFTMAGALGTFTPSVEAFADSFIPSGAEPSPPSTPEGRTSDTPRRSSYLLGQHVLRSARSADDLPPFVPDLDTLRGGVPSRAYGDSSRPSLQARRRSSDFYRQSLSRPPLSGVARRAIHRSSRSWTSNGTSGPRRRASFHSGVDRRSTARSFDATTYSYRSSLSQSPSASVPVPQPLRVLRRRPGGDLRAVQNVVNLGHAELRRSRSLGSLTTGTYASSYGTSLIMTSAIPRDSTGVVDGVNSDYSRDQRAAFSLGAMADKPKRRISLLTSVGSRPIMRPSFEAEAQKLANIPDDDDDGGVESALLKLEGKYDKKAFKLSMEPVNAPLRPARRLFRPSSSAQIEAPQAIAEKKRHRHERVVEDGLSPYSPPPDVDSTPLPSSSSSFILSGRPSMGPQVQVDVQSVASGSTNNSYVSVPLLQRGLTDDGTRSRVGWTNRSIFQDDDDESSEDENIQDRKSYEFVKKSSSVEDVRPRDTIPTRKRSNTRTSQVSQGSFLNMDDTDDDELSSELSDIPMEEDEDMAFPTLRPNASLTKIRTTGTGMRPEAGQLSSPVAMPLRVEPVAEAYNGQAFGLKPLPPTPDYTPTFGQAGSNTSKGTPDPSGVNAALRNAADVIEHEANTRKYSAHLPFILAFESEILAQQFTLIEKDALNEIDWKELIDMRWKNAENNDARSWVHFLRDTDARGVEVVIARFNIVVKWAISEIVLTQDIEERARTIIKYIHIASHCRRYRNFATMAQIAVALTSGEIGRLSRTWKLVPASDVLVLHDLEALISPTRNFYALRAEMEGGSGTGSTACIPFVGIYTHDLIFNSQRPGEIASSPTTAPLVNFERCRVAAGIVKALLRLLEASGAYDFEPIEGVTERCLWMSALSDEEIRQCSSRLE